MAGETPVTIAVINYNGGQTLVDTVDSLILMDYPERTVMVVDNGSTDNSLAILTTRHPDVEVVHLPENRGPSAARNVAIARSKTNLVFLSDNDITASRDMLSLLAETLRTHPEAVTCSPRIMYSDGRTIQSDGVDMHYLAMSMPAHRRMPAADVHDTTPRTHPCASGGMMLVDKSKLDPSDFFDEDYFFGWDDAEFSYRLSLTGRTSVSVPSALICHKEKKWGTRRSFQQLRNRWFFLLINYSSMTLFLIAPVLVVYEIILMVFMMAKGGTATYFRAMTDVVRNMGRIRTKRRLVQAKRRVPDTSLLATGNIYIEEGLIGNRLILSLARVVNRAFDLHWRLVSAILPKRNKTQKHAEGTRGNATA